MNHSFLFLLIFLVLSFDSVSDSLRIQGERVSERIWRKIGPGGAS